MSDTRQARIEAAMTALFQGERGDVALGYYTVRSRMDAALQAADAIGRERVSAGTLDRLRSWAEFFAPFVEDDNRWYGEQHMDGKDAGEVGELLQEIRAILTAQPEPGGSDAGQPATPEGGQP